MIVTRWSTAGLGLAAVTVLALTGCTLLQDDAPFEAEGMPAASEDEVTDMFKVDQNLHPDGAPREAIYKGKVMGAWTPVSSTSSGCIEYQLEPDPDQNLAKPDITHFWHGDVYRVEQEGCQPVEDIVHSNGE